jgi:flagellin-specific chaperone FliS
MNFEVATQLNEQLMGLVDHANQALFIANNSGDAELRSKLQRVLASAIAELDLQVWESIYQQHPSLRPAEMTPVSRGDD